MLPNRLTLILTSLALTGAAAAAATTLRPASPFTQEGIPGMEQSAEHKKVQAGVGQWEGVLTMPNPMGEGEVEMPCAERVEAVGQLWTVSHFECEMAPGMTFEGSSTFGFDPVKQKYVGTWVDAFNPQLTTMEGEELEDGAISMVYEQMNAELEKMTRRRNVMHHEGDQNTMKFYETIDGVEQHIMTITMKRKK